MEILITISIDKDERKLYIDQENTSGCEYDIYKNSDIFRCIENDKLYTPGENELFLYVEKNKFTLAQHWHCFAIEV